jgi:hypothetical protein
VFTAFCTSLREGTQQGADGPPSPGALPLLHPDGCAHTAWHALAWLARGTDHIPPNPRTVTHPRTTKKGSSRDMSTPCPPPPGRTPSWLAPASPVPSSGENTPPPPPPPRHHREPASKGEREARSAGTSALFAAILVMGRGGFRCACAAPTPRTPRSGAVF